MQYNSCTDLQIIALHDYNLSPSYVASHIDAAKPLAINSGKRLLYEEFGALGDSKQSQIQAVVNTLISVSFNSPLRVLVRSRGAWAAADCFDA